jgi:hypothetical protein
MPTDAVTQYKNLPKPHVDNDLDYDMARIALMVEMVDVLLNTIDATLAGKAASAHGHEIGDVTGLQNALDTLTNSVSGLPDTLAALQDTDTADVTQGMMLQYLTGKWTAIVAKAAFFGIDPISGLTANNVQEALSSLQATKANQADIQAALDDLVGAAPGTLDKLNELAAALGNDPDFATTITGQIAGKLGATDKAVDSDKLDGLNSSQLLRSDVSGTITGNLTATGHVYSRGYVYVNMDLSGDAWVVFKDANSGGADRLLGWDDSANALVGEENDGGIHKLALVYDGSSANETNYPIGTIVQAYTNNVVNRNSSTAVYQMSGTSHSFTASGGGNFGSQLSGTWRAKGTNGQHTLYQRVA